MTPLPGRRQVGLWGVDDSESRQAPVTWTWLGKVLMAPLFLQVDLERTGAGKERFTPSYFEERGGGLFQKWRV